MKDNAIKNRMNDEIYYSHFITEKMKEMKTEKQMTDDFTRQTLAEFDVILHMADAMAKELPATSFAKYGYELMKQKLNIK